MIMSVRVFEGRRRRVLLWVPRLAPPALPSACRDDLPVFSLHACASVFGG